MPRWPRYFAEYKCGDVSEIGQKIDIIDYCPTCGKNVRYWWPILSDLEEKENDDTERGQAT